MNIYVCMARICILYNAAENARLRYADNDIYIYITPGKSAKESLRIIPM